ncbi:MAG: hypothetical protein WD734_05545, partial [Dehalococcoidia bacterium]
RVVRMGASRQQPHGHAGVTRALAVLHAAGIETFEPSEGAPTPDLTVRFNGGDAEGYRAIATAVDADLPVAELRRAWRLDGTVIIGPWWEITLFNREPSAE